MITYEVTATVDPRITEEYERYMRTRHIPDVLASGCFLEASFGTSGAGTYRIRYEAPDRATLERYVVEHAPRLRADVERHFPTGVQLSREVWEKIDDWRGEQARSR